MTDEARIRIEPLRRDESKGLIRLHADTLLAKLHLVEIAGGMDRELALEARMAEEAAQQVISGSQKLFRVSCVLILRESSFEALRRKADAFWDTVMGVVTELDSPKGIQHIMVSGNGSPSLQGANLLMPTDSVLAFFPFAGLDLIEHNGVFLGTNMQTKGPIIYDLYKKSNAHMVVVGKTGAGKSMLLKSWISRMAITYPDLAFMVFDSIKESEYAKGADGTYDHSFAGMTGAKVVRFNPSESMGLDPIRLFNRKQAASLLARMAQIGQDEKDLRSELSKIVQSETTATVNDVYEAQTSEKLKLRIDANLRPLNFMFEGEPQRPWARTVFVLDDLPDDEEMRGSAVVLASALAMAALKSLPIPRKKVLLIDEAWAFLATDDRGRLYFSEAMDIVSEMARTGRHYNVSLVLATQYGKDLMGGQGKTALESCATKVILHQDPAGQGGGSDLAEQLFGLSEQQRAFIERADPGFGIMITEQGRVPFYNKLTDLEYGYFTTKPEEVGTPPSTISL
ncbi:MAG: ATP-binding protein [Nitrososphaerales archaeon]|nr:ATP-binding protein [Nitrososphaerales archaeon]